MILILELGTIACAITLAACAAGLVAIKRAQRSKQPSPTLPGLTHAQSENVRRGFPL